jgi:hypothetical protein
MVQRAKGSRRGSRGPASGVRAILLAHRRKRLGPGSRWHIHGRRDEIAAALEDCKPVIVSSSLLWSALSTAGLPNDEYGRDAPLDGKHWLVDEHDGFSEWTDEHPAFVEELAAWEARGRKCGCPRGACIRCDPHGTGKQTVEIAPRQRPWDWWFIEWEPESVGG